MNVLIALLIFGLIVYLVFWIIGMLQIPEPAKQIITVVVAVIFLIQLISMLGGFPLIPYHIVR